MPARKEDKGSRAGTSKRPANGGTGESGHKRPRLTPGGGCKPAAYTQNPGEKITRKERKEVSNARKAKRSRNFTLIQEVVPQWEALRRHDTTPARRSELVTTILKKVVGRVADLAASHTASRVIQACVKYGTVQERAAILKELDPQLLPLCKSAYGRFVVSKLVDLAPKEQLATILKRLKGHAAELLRHPAGTHVLDDLYTAADAAQRNALAAEFYGREYSLFEGGTINGVSGGAPARLAELLEAVDAGKRRSIVQHLATTLSPVIEKGLVDCQLAHRLIHEYLSSAPASLVADSVESLSGDALLHMVHTHEGVAAACMTLAYGTARDRKKAVRAFKGHVAAAVRDEWGHLVVATALTVVDDTALLRKFVVGDLQADLAELVPHRSGHRVLLQLLHPGCTLYLSPDLLAIVTPPAKVYEATAAAAAAQQQPAADAAAEEKPAAGTGGEEEQEEGSDDEGAPPERAASGPLGVSKKDPEARRKELLAGGLGSALAALCAESAAGWITTQHAADVVVEVCRGGEGGVLEDVVGAEAVDAVHAALVAAAAQPGGEEHVLESYWGSRALRRLVLASSEEGPAGVAAARFVDALWIGGFKGRCKEFVGTHAAKVLAAVVHSGSSAARKGAAAELRKALPKGTKTVEAWAEGFLHAKRAG